MSDSNTEANAKRVLKVFMGILLAFGIVMVVLGEFLIAGVTFLGLTFVIYLRETW